MRVSQCCLCWPLLCEREQGAHITYSSVRAMNPAVREAGRLSEAAPTLTGFRPPLAALALRLCSVPPKIAGSRELHAFELGSNAWAPAGLCDICEANAHVLSGQKCSERLICRRVRHRKPWALRHGSREPGGTSMGVPRHPCCGPGLCSAAQRHRQNAIRSC